MTFVANVVRVMIASPSDLSGSRDTVEAAIHGWNTANSKNKQIVLLPWRWETSAVPTLGDRAQALINLQGVDDSDIVIALFGSRLGSPTGEAVSGTVEEINRALGQGTPIHVYFSKGMLANDVDLEQVAAVRDFKKGIEGLYGEFTTDSELNFEVWKAIEHDLAVLGLGAPAAPKTNTGVEFLVQPDSAREVKYNSKGQPRSTMRWWLDITNRGSQDAENVRIENANPESAMHLMADDEPTTIHAGQTRRVPTVLKMGGDGQKKVRISWNEDGEERSKVFHV